MDKALQTMIDNMPAKTGKSLAEWKKLLKEKSFSRHGEAMKFLKEEYGVTHGFANTIIILAKEEEVRPNELVENQYQGKETLRPIYEVLIAFVTTLGPEVTITPKKTSVSLIRKKQFALISPATKTRVDLGLKLVGKETTERLGNSGPFGTMCTHRVQLTNTEEVDQEVKDWLKEAYERAI